MGNVILTPTKDTSLNKGSETKTPIEIALGVDENGMTTAKKLYEFLELAPGNYARWCKSNITENEFAEESIDYYSSLMKSEGKGNFAEDYKLTAHFAKKLSMKGNSARAEEAREYFTRLEEKVKQNVIDRQQLSPQLQMFGQMFEAMAKQELEQKRQAEQINRIEKKQEVIVETFKQTTDAEDFQVWVKNCLAKIAESGNYRRDLGRNERYRAVTTESYVRLVQKMNCRLEQLVANAKARALQNNPGIRKSELDKINKLYVITNEKRLRVSYELVIKEMMMCYCSEVA